MNKIQIIQKAPLRNIENLVIAGHILISLAMWVSYNQRLIHVDTLKDIVHGYFLMMPMFLIGLMFRNLRNFNFFIIWLIIGLIQLVLYPILNPINDFQFYRGTAFSGLRILLPTMVMFQVLRIIFIKTHNLEMIISIRKHRMSRWEDEENRNMTWLEVAYSIILLATILIANGI